MKSVFCLIIAMLMKKAVFSLCGADFSQWEMAGCFEVKCVSCDCWGFHPKEDFLSFFKEWMKINCSLIPLCLLGFIEGHTSSMSSEVAAGFSLEPHSKMSQKRSKDFACRACQGKYCLWNGNSETIYRVPGMIRNKDDVQLSTSSE